MRFLAQLLLLLLMLLKIKIPKLEIQSKKTDYDAKINDIEDKHLATYDYNKFASVILYPNITKKSINESNISGFINDSDLNEKIKTLVTKVELKAKQDKIVKLETHDLIYFLDKSVLVMMVFKICLFINQHLIHYS